MKKIKLSIVSYVNTLPFIYGLENSAIIDKVLITKDTPSECAKKLISGAADIGLVPVVLLADNPDLEIISDYCIGSKGKVDSVCLLSNVPLTEITTIKLDYQSLSSINLVQILCANYWNIKPEFIHTQQGFEANIEDNDAAVIIGDRCFEKKNNFKFVRDLSEEWNNFTGLPFVFAGWASNKPIDSENINELNKAFALGVNNIKTIIDQHSTAFPNINLSQYFQENIAYHLDDEMKKGMTLFLQYYKSE